MTLGPVRDVRFLYDFMVGPKGVSPNVSIANGELGWTVLVDERPDGKPDREHIWVGHIEYGWTRQHSANARFVRWWLAEDASEPHYPKALKPPPPKEAA